MIKVHVLLAIFFLMLCLALPTSGQGARLDFIGGEFAISGYASASLGTVVTNADPSA